MAGRFLDFMAQGPDASLPAAAGMPSLIPSGAAAVYYANDAGKFYFFNEDTVAWDPLDLTVLTGLYSDLADVDWGTPATDGQIMQFSSADSKWHPVDIPAGYDDSMADARIAAASIYDLANVDGTGEATGKALIFDGTNYVPTAIPAGYDDEMARDAIGTALTAGSGATITVNDGANTITIAVDPEFIRDTIAACLTAGAGITITPNDPGDTIAIASSITQYTDEMARDAIGTALVAGSGVTVTVNDAGDTITIAAAGGASGILWAVDATGTGASQAITLPASVSNAQDILVFVNGIRWKASEYSVSTTTLTITTNASGDNVQVIGIATSGMTSVSIDALNDVDTTTTTPVAGDLLRFDGTNWKPAKGGKVLLGSQTASNSAQLDFTSLITSTYDEYEFEFIDILPATNGQGITARLSTNNGSSYDTSAIYDTGMGIAGSTDWYSGANGEASQGRWLLSGDCSNGATASICGSMKLFNPLGTVSHKKFTSDCVADGSDGNLYRHYAAGRYRSTTAVNAIRFMFSTGNITSGTIRMYGIVK